MGRLRFAPLPDDDCAPDAGAPPSRADGGGWWRSSIWDSGRDREAVDLGPADPVDDDREDEDERVHGSGRDASPWRPAACAN